WIADKQIITATLDRDGGLDSKGGLDAAVLLAVLHAQTQGDDFFSPTDDKVLATTAALLSTFDKLFDINKTKKDGDGEAMGTAIGRYPEDRYGGQQGTSEGNAWVLCTLAVAELDYRAAKEWERKGQIAVTELNLPFFGALNADKFKTIKAGQTLRKNERMFRDAIAELRLAADRQLRRVKYHAFPDGSLSEQMNRHTGFMQSARDLTWNYASVLTTLAQRDANVMRKAISFAVPPSTAALNRGGIPIVERRPEAEASPLPAARRVPGSMAELRLRVAELEATVDALSHDGGGTRQSGRRMSPEAFHPSAPAHTGQPFRLRLVAALVRRPLVAGHAFGKQRARRATFPRASPERPLQANRRVVHLKCDKTCLHSQTSATYPRPLRPGSSRGGQPATCKSMLAQTLFPSGGTTMNEIENRLREALAKIAREASGAVNGGEAPSEEHNGDVPDHEAQEGKLTCTPKALPKRLLVKAAETAKRINPVNAPAFGPLAHVAADFHVTDPMRIAVLTAKYWGPSPRRLTVSFMESTPADLRSRILSHMNAWTRTACISFVETSGTGDVRISREAGGYWSYLGTDILHIPRNRQTMNLEGFTMTTIDSEYKRVIRHETGHTLGFPHEHMRKALVARIDPQKAYVFFLATQGWDKPTVDAQVLTPLDEKSLISTPLDQTSIMCYQLPASITRDGLPILGGVDINSTDYAFAGKIYPKSAYGSALGDEGEWTESEDVRVTV
ncbi:MAG TPA: glycoside hydrolase family 15 protein, partial [Gemmataceae bacterium]|nr:glycoside hydrolase family 15 protein [Gemmataceae bacterium]